MTWCMPCCMMNGRPGRDESICPHLPRRGLRASDGRVQRLPAKRGGFPGPTLLGDTSRHAADGARRRETIEPMSERPRPRRFSGVAVVRDSLPWPGEAIRRTPGHARVAAPRRARAAGQPPAGCSIQAGRSTGRSTGRPGTWSELSGNVSERRPVAQPKQAATLRCPGLHGQGER
jgi:hypothetical protein